MTRVVFQEKVASEAMPASRSAIAICLCLVLRCACASDQAGEVGSSPARLIDAESSLVAHVMIPTGINEAQFIIRCSVVVAASGRLSRNVCVDAVGKDAATIGRSDLVRLARGISRAIERTRASPARIDGKARRVWMNYGVEFLRRDETYSIHVHEYFVVNAENLQPGFVGAQRTVSFSRPWGEHCMGEDASLFWVVVKLDAQGKPESIHVKPEDLSHPCQKSLHRAVKSSDYTPAIANGRAVPETSFIEPFYYRRRGIVLY